MYNVKFAYLNILTASYFNYLAFSTIGAPEIKSLNLKLNLRFLSVFPVLFSQAQSVYGALVQFLHLAVLFRRRLLVWLVSVCSRRLASKTFQLHLPIPGHFFYLRI